MRKLISALVLSVSALATLSIAAPAQAARALPTIQADYAQVARPATLRLYKDVTVTGIRYTSWKPTYSNATGVIRVNICQPSCARGWVVSQRVNLVYRVTTNPRYTRSYYNCVRVTWGYGIMSRLHEGSSGMNVPVSAAARRSARTDRYGTQSSICGYQGIYDY